MEDDETTVETPQLTPEQIEKGCRIEDGRIVCPTTKEQPQSSKNLDDGMTSIALGNQKIQNLRCDRNRKTDEMICTVKSKANK